MSKPAARIGDPVVHPLPPVLTGGPGSFDVLIGGKPAWRGIPAASAAALQVAKKASDLAIKTAESATLAAAGTPAAPGFKAAEETTKATAASTMGSMISGMAMGADIHGCTTPLPVPPHGPGVVIDGSATVLINGLPACRMGDTIVEAVGPPNKIAMGCPTVLIGDGGAGAGLGAGSGTGLGGGSGRGSGGGSDSFEDLIDGIDIDGDEQYQEQVRENLREIYDTPSGQELLESLREARDNGRSLTITAPPPGRPGNACGYDNPRDRFIQPNGQPGAGTNATVYFNPNSTSIGSEPWQTRPPAIGLAHELIHADDAAYGRMPRGDGVNGDLAPSTESNRELRAVGLPPYENGLGDDASYTENAIRDEMGEPQRPHY
ncbi:M91 family zinc metallopeptidase [Coleofasciculus sp. E2-BRE-01]|uniref:M91 family zinc metallopeptidase n=1 Tax=Coleofasciculus sp. E2-BRE-01 TaxID=3069524 RepID=UPI00330345F5